MTEIVAVDIGGTHARFAIATLEGSRVTSLADEVVLKTADHADLAAAWSAFASRLGRPLPRAAAIAVAGPVGGEILQLTNHPWTLRPAAFPAALGVDRFSLVNDFGAVGHAVAQLDARWFRHICGPDVPLPDPGVISVVGPGTGLGVAIVARSAQGARVIECEGGHADFAPLDPLEDRILARLRDLRRRVSVERVVSGPGLAVILAALAEGEGLAVEPIDDETLWSRALAGGDALAAAAFDRFCKCLGSASGDIALVQGAQAVVIAGGLGLRLAGRLAASGFEAGFRAKGRMEARMAAMPVKSLTYPEPGLLGAALAFAQGVG
ncbi:MAG TPA: glucokinase [Caulobacteraceae bacterium]|nr:glucokinase [Caulobacteraceae bacterium]